MICDRGANQWLPGQLPEDADGLAFNPAGDMLAYRLYETSQLCTSKPDGSDAECGEETE